MSYISVATKQYSMRFERPEDLDRELRAILSFVSRFDGSFKKLGENDIDYLVYKNDNPLCYVEVKGRKRSVSNSYPLPLAARKAVKLSDKRLNPVVLWSCDDGIIYGEIRKLYGNFEWGGRKPRDGSVNDGELMIYYSPQEELKCIKYIDLPF